MTIGGCEKRDCPAFDKCTAQYRGSRCAALRYSYGLDDPKTNYDRIISKSPEELAVFLTNTQINTFNEVVVAINKMFDCEENILRQIKEEVQKNYEDIVQEQLDWLRQEAEE